MPMTRVLIVDDQSAFSELVCVALRDVGYTCVAVGTVADGRRELATGAHDVVAVDLYLPDGDGIQLAKDAERHSVKFIAVPVTWLPLRLFSNNGTRLPAKAVQHRATCRDSPDRRRRAPRYSGRLWCSNTVRIVSAKDFEPVFRLMAARWFSTVL
jgi:CheY-like chemotaxis protein